MRLRWRGRGAGEGRNKYPQGLGEVRGVFVDLQPGRKVAWLWEAQAPGPGTPRLVSFFILPSGRSSEVSIQHCGFEPGPGAEPLFKGFKAGWTDALSRLKRHVEGMAP